MKKEKLFDRLLTCNAAQLTAVTAKLQLNTAFLPGGNEAAAVRAEAILKLVEQRGANGLAALEKTLIEMFGRPKPEPEKGDAGKPKKADTQKKSRCILILAANPVDRDPLRLDLEVKRIRQQLEKGEEGRRYLVETEWAVSANELSEYLLRYKPSIVHFSGHGSYTGEIMLEGENGQAKPVPARALVDLFDTLKGTEAIVLNACYSMEQAKALAKVIPQVVGMARAIGDDSALRFSEGFYGGLAFGKDYATAFRLGCIAIDLAALPDAAVPHFTTRSEDRIAAKTTAASAPESISLKSADGPTT